MHVTFHDPRCLNAMQNLKQGFRDVLDKHPKKFTNQKMTLYGPKMPFFYRKKEFFCRKINQYFSIFNVSFRANVQTNIKTRCRAGP